MAGNIYTAIAGWTILGGIGVFLYFLNRQRKYRARRGAPLRPAEKAIEPRKEPKARKARKEVGHSGGEQDNKSGDSGSKKKNKEKTITAIREVDASPFLARDNEKDAEIEFARQLSSAKTGTLLGSKPQAAARQKSIKQSRAQEKPAVVETSSDNATAPSSAAGGDADDDQSPVSSPELSATTTNGDDPVADMLQPASPGASVLKITEPTTPARPKKENRPKTYEAVETKKQRQNRKKAEAKKLALQEEEKERKILMEKQRRTAREAEGRAAKDGSAFMAAKTPSSSAWTAPLTTSNGQTNSESKPLELLDTYEPSTSKDAPAPARIYSQSQEMGDALLNDPEEERQLRMAIQESNWEVVKEKKSRKAKKPGAEQDIKEKQDTATGQTGPSKQEDFGVPQVIKPTPAGQKWDMTLVAVTPEGEVDEYEKEVRDSEWEVA